MKRLYYYFYQSNVCKFGYLFVLVTAAFNQHIKKFLDKTVQMYFTLYFHYEHKKTEGRL